MYATTNYDWIGEAALSQLGRRPEWGERRDVIGPGMGGPVTVDVERLLDGLPRTTPVLHLHGAVGWYRRADPSAVIVANARYDPDFGVPVVMLPNPAKDYASDTLVQSLWTQFNDALRRPSMVLVLGHSLNDAALVDALRSNVAPLYRVAVTLLASESDSNQVDESASSTEERLTEVMPEATMIPLRFGLEFKPPTQKLAQWAERTGWMERQRRGA